MNKSPLNIFFDACIGAMCCGKR